MRLLTVRIAWPIVPNGVHRQRKDPNLASMQQTLLGRRSVNRHTEMRSTERTTRTGHQVHAEWSSDIGHSMTTQQVLEALATVHPEANALTIVVVAVEAVTLLEVVVRFASNSQERAFGVNAFEHKLMAANVIAGQKLLDAGEKRLLMIMVDDLDHISIAAGILEASVRVKIDVANRVPHSESSAGERNRIRMNDVHELGIRSIQPHQRICIAEEWLCRIHSGDPTQHQTKVLLQSVPSVATQMGAQRVTHHVHPVETGQPHLLVDHVNHVGSNRTDQSNIGHRLGVRRRRSVAPVDDHHGRRAIFVVVQQSVHHILDLNQIQYGSFIFTT